MEATAYISAVAAFAAVVLVVLLFLGRRWCHSAVLSRRGREELVVSSDAPCLSHAHGMFVLPYISQVVDSSEIRIALRRNCKELIQT